MSKLSKLRSTSFFICSPRVYAKAFVSKIGHAPLVWSYWRHALQFEWYVGLLPSQMFPGSCYEFPIGSCSRCYSIEEKASERGHIRRRNSNKNSSNFAFIGLCLILPTSSLIELHKFALNVPIVFVFPITALGSRLTARIPPKSDSEIRGSFWYLVWAFPLVH